MIYKTSRHITDKLIRHGRVDSDDRELFEYGIFLVISQMIYALVCIICGIVFKCIAESLVLYVSFNFARKYSGGFHASTELRCFIFSSLSILCSVSLIKTFEIKDLCVPFIILLAAASAVIIIFSPLDTDEKPLTEDEKVLVKYPLRNGRRHEVSRIEPQASVTLQKSKTADVRKMGVPHLAFLPLSHHIFRKLNPLEYTLPVKDYQFLGAILPYASPAGFYDGRGLVFALKPDAEYTLLSGTPCLNASRR